MTNVADAAPVSSQTEPPARPSFRTMLAQTEIDLRLFGMLVALAAILLTFQILSGGKFFQPTNMITLAVQASGVAVIATGMVLVIVSRNIDLSVGSLVGLIAMTYALLMTDWLPNVLGIGAGLPVPVGHRAGDRDGPRRRDREPSRASSSRISACHPSSSRWVDCCRSAGWSGTCPAAPRSRVSTRTSSSSVAARRGRSEVTLTWVLGLVGCVAIVALLINSRRQRRRYGFPFRPMWAEVLLGVVGCLAVLGVAAFANANLWPQGLANRVAIEQNWGPTPQGGWQIPTGFPFPIILLHRRHPGDDMDGDPTAVRTVRVRVRR